jgi:hypothetical protein
VTQLAVLLAAWEIRSSYPRSKPDMPIAKIHGFPQSALKNSGIVPEVTSRQLPLFPRSVVRNMKDERVSPRRLFSNRAAQLGSWAGQMYPSGRFVVNGRAERKCGTFCVAFSHILRRMLGPWITGSPTYCGL